MICKRNLSGKTYTHHTGTSSSVGILLFQVGFVGGFGRGHPSERSYPNGDKLVIKGAFYTLATHATSVITRVYIQSLL